MSQLDDYLAGLGLSPGTLVSFDARGKLAARKVRFEDMATPEAERRA